MISMDLEGRRSCGSLPRATPILLGTFLATWQVVKSRYCVAKLRIVMSKKLGTLHAENNLKKSEVKACEAR